MKYQRFRLSPRPPPTLRSIANFSGGNCIYGMSGNREFENVNISLDVWQKPRVDTAGGTKVYVFQRRKLYVLNNWKS